MIRPASNEIQRKINYTYCAAFLLVVSITELHDTMYNTVLLLLVSFAISRGLFAENEVNTKAYKMARKWVECVCMYICIYI
jgi:hypothetical protein